MGATDLHRILEYDRLVDAHRNEAVRLSREPCAAGGERVLPGAYLCPLTP
jgi:hypothetical protein